ncbi:CsxC family protein [Viridibacillus arvi]|uniref:CsxC family protein n=1 Tax=Viridibacillus arvi TaxID=263475 RepID=UPI001D0FCC9F|nr:Uracil permease [Viridibacillus sp. JNUCC-6]
MKNCNNSNNSQQQQQQQPLQPACTVPAMQQIPVADNAVVNNESLRLPIMKVPVVLVERSLQIVVEADIPLNPAATEIKRVTKNAFLNQVKLVPVQFAQIDDTNFFEVRRAKLFVSGFIRKNIEYSTNACQGVLQDRIVEVPFAGFAEITAGEFLTPPVIGLSDSKKAYFLNDTNGEVPRLDKNFFANSVTYNEQPYGELIGANFFELDFSPVTVAPEGQFGTLREKIVMDVIVKVLQVQQHRVASTRIIPTFGTGLDC